MGDFFKKVGDGISTTSKNIKTSVDISRKKSAIRKHIQDIEGKIKKLKLSVGEKMYGIYKGEFEADSFDEVFREIDELYIEIEIEENKILELDGIKICPKCGSKIAVDSVFCPKCGFRQEAEIVVEEPIEAQAEQVTSDDDNTIRL